ncbi:hypothetical protein SBRCBS47491_010106 [Sporothrix bragantina]|uniref:Zn(2)-C6 fungal-type domain-containing protein n=1 Tax=Sporothrix bragantina TaxID=671064 RepID=A0ABP0D006_9PEZI
MAATPKKRRSRLACQRCHNRRVRCDASAQGPPCSHCISSNLASSCRLIESRKVRGERGRFSSLAVEKVNEVSPAGPALNGASLGLQPTELTASPTHRPGEPIPTDNDAFDIADDQANSIADDCLNEVSNDSTFVPETADNADAINNRPQVSRVDTPSEADQWTKIVTRESIPVSDSGRITYLGESWNLSYCLQWTSHSRAVAGETGQQNSIGNANNANRAVSLDNASPSSLSDGNSPSIHITMPSSETLGYGRSHKQKKGHLGMLASGPRPSIRASQDASTLDEWLPLSLQRALIDAYCQHHLTLYPIVCETRLRANFDEKTVSPVLLAAVLYAGAIHAPDAVIYRAGFDTRQACLRKLYLCAKSLFFEEDEEDGATIDGSESDPLARVQAAFLLHHMWFRPNSTMDCWTWLSLAVRLAQKMGMHRSTARSSLREEDRKLWKRIWWSLYTRDSQLASGVGKPIIINELDCDVEPLTMDDFEDHHCHEVRLFAIHQAHMADICKQVMRSRFSPRCASQSLDAVRKAELVRDLENWKASLPGLVTYRPNQDQEHTPIEALLLEALYK